MSTSLRIQVTDLKLRSLRSLEFGIRDLESPKMARSDRFAYSLTGDHYIGMYPTREQARDAAIAHARQVEDPPLTVYVGRLIPALPDCHGHARVVIDHMRERASLENRPETVEHLDSVNAAEIDELDKALAEAIHRWLKQHGPAALFEVEAISEHTVPFPPEVRSGPTDEVHEIGETRFPGE
jgi:hypothetical protein